MGIENLNEYRVDFADNTSKIFMAKNARSAVNALETDILQVAQLSRLKTGVGVQTPIRNVKFTVEVTPEGAAANKCLATPSTWVVPEGTDVIFTAIPAQGFEFEGWFEKGGTNPLSTDLVSQFVVVYPTEPNALSKEYEARFVVTP
jgi:hypothetical protein